MDSKPNENMNGTEQAELEVVDIMSRDGAISILRQVREDIRAIGMAGFALAPEQQQIQALKLLCEQANAQIFAMSVMLSGILGDPLVADELNADITEVLDVEAP